MMQQISERVWMLPHDDHGDRPVLGYVRGDRYALMIDAGNSAAHAAAFYEGLAAAGLPRPDFVALTHWHWDHSFGLAAVDCPAIAQALTNLYLRDVMGWAWTDEAMARRLETGEDNEFCDRSIREEYADRGEISIRLADITFADTLTLDLGGVACQMLHIDAPHTADSVILHLPGEGVLFLGDADCEGHHHGRESLYRPKLCRLHDFLSRLQFATCVPGHGAPCGKDALLAALREARDA